jgi:hypothetical protein
MYIQVTGNHYDNVGIYNLLNPADLEYDLNNLLGRLNELFVINVTDDKVNAFPI